MRNLHGDPIAFDGPIIARRDQDLFQNLRRGGLAAASCTCSIRVGFAETMRTIAARGRWFEAQGEADIRRAKADGEASILPGF